MPLSKEAVELLTDLAPPVYEGVLEIVRALHKHDEVGSRAALEAALRLQFEARNTINRKH